MGPLRASLKSRARLVFSKQNRPFVLTVAATTHAKYSETEYWYVYNASAKSKVLSGGSSSYGFELPTNASGCPVCVVFYQNIYGPKV